MRRGAWRAATSSAADTLRQAAHSGRELVSQVLHVVSPDDEVRGRSWFNPNPKKPHEITRKNRFKNAIGKRGRGWSESDLTVAEKMGDLLEAQHVKLSANAHLHGPVERQTVVDALTTVDMVLRILLV
ncbi:putative pPIWI-associating nuclease [compost metagenome]